MGNKLLIFFCVSVCLDFKHISITKSAKQYNELLGYGLWWVIKPTELQFPTYGGK